MIIHGREGNLVVVLDGARLWSPSLARSYFWHTENLLTSHA